MTACPPVNDYFPPCWPLSKSELLNSDSYGIQWMTIYGDLQGGTSPVNACVFLGFVSVRKTASFLLNGQKAT
jgi:hypothetical protein